MAHSFRFWLTDRTGDHPLVRVEHRGEMVLVSLQPACGMDRHWLRGEYGECADAIAERVADAAAEALFSNPWHVPTFCGYDDSEDMAIAAVEMHAMAKEAA